MPDDFYVIAMRVAREMAREGKFLPPETLPRPPRGEPPCEDVHAIMRAVGQQMDRQDWARFYGIRS